MLRQAFQKWRGNCSDLLCVIAVAQTRSCFWKTLKFGVVWKHFLNEANDLRATVIEILAANEHTVLSRGCFDGVVSAAPAEYIVNYRVSGAAARKQ